MIEKELKRMSRGELLELLIAQMAENETLKKDLACAQAALEDKRIVVENAGSLAEAAMQLSGVFDAAQDAAQKYLDNLRMMDEQREQTTQKIEAEAREKAVAILAAATADSQQQRAEAEEYSRLQRAEAEEYGQQQRAEAEEYSRKIRGEADACMQKAQEKADAYWQQVNERVSRLLREQESLQSLLHHGGNDHP